MLAVILLTLIASIVAVALLCFAMFLEEAFCPRTPVDVTAALPIVTGATLCAWSRQLAQRCIAQQTRGARGAIAPVILVCEMARAMNDLVLRLLPNSRRALSGACPSCRRERIPITAPEALALADDLRGCQRMGTIQRVRAAAQRNLQASNVPGDSSDDSICPLYCSSGCCLTHAARPLFCRGRDFADDGTRSTKSPIQQDAEQSLGTALGVGMLSGLAGALQAANHDGGVYELNSALLTALDVPDAARRWAHGEPVFATCATVDVVM